MNLRTQLKFARALLLVGVIFNALASAVIVYKGLEHDKPLLFGLAFFLACLSFVNGYILGKIQKV